MEKEYDNLSDLQNCNQNPQREEILESDSDLKKKILKKRARLLSRKPEKGNANENCIDVLEFMLGHERYAIEAMYIREVHPLKEITPLPCTPPFVLGIINVRRQILPVIDIKKFFGFPEKDMNGLKKIIIVKRIDMEFGILADSIVGVASVPVKEIQQPLPTLKGKGLEYLRGLTAAPLMILDMEKIFSDKNIIVYEKVE